MAFPCFLFLRIKGGWEKRKVMKIKNKIFLVTTVCMMCLCAFGVYGLITAPHKAQIAMDEAERKLKEAQEKAEKNRIQTDS